MFNQISAPPTRIHQTLPVMTDELIVGQVEKNNFMKQRAAKSLIIAVNNALEIASFKPNQACDLISLPSHLSKIGQEAVQITQDKLLEWLFENSIPSGNYLVFRQKTGDTHVIWDAVISKSDKYRLANHIPSDSDQPNPHTSCKFQFRINVNHTCNSLFKSLMSRDE